MNSTLSIIKGHYESFDCEELDDLGYAIDQMEDEDERDEAQELYSEFLVLYELLELRVDEYVKERNSTSPSLLKLAAAIKSMDELANKIVLSKKELNSKVLK